MSRSVETIPARDGLYNNYRFDDESLRKLGLRCEELFPKRCIPTVLRSLAKNAKGYEGKEGFKVMIVKAEDVLETPSDVKEGTYALYLSPRGLEVSHSCTESEDVEVKSLRGLVDKVLDKDDGNPSQS